MHQIIGILMIATLFIGIFLMSIKTIGFKNAIIVWGTTLFIAGWLFLGVHLANAAEQEDYAFYLSEYFETEIIIDTKFPVTCEILKSITELRGVATVRYQTKYKIKVIVDDLFDRSSILPSLRCLLDTDIKPCFLIIEDDCHCEEKAPPVNYFHNIYGVNCN